ncbi:MAG: branched-chain amino acid ABC transporter permease [Burkholderiales bacterium]
MLAQQIVNGLSLGAVYAMVALAFTLTMGILNFLNFSIPGIFMLAGMCVWAGLRAGMPLAVVLLLAVAVGALTSLLVERFTYRRMQGGNHMIPLVSSMAFLILFENSVLIAWGSDLQRVELPFRSVSVTVGSAVVSVPQIVGLIGAVGAIWALDLVLKRTRVGRGLRTIAENAETAAMLGIPVGRIVPVVFLIGGVFTALAGFTFAITYQQVHPFMGEEVALKAISAMVIGGMGNIWGAILGGLAIGIVETAAIQWFGARTVDIWVYGLLLVILFFRPTGLLGGGTPAAGRV